jgi:malic enzyme
VLVLKRGTWDDLYFPFSTGLKQFMQKDLRKQEALRYHSKGKPGKIEVVPTKEAKTQRYLSLAYSPGVA